MDFYSLDMILAIGYRVRSHRGVQFRRWAAERLKEYMVKGFVLDGHMMEEMDDINWQAEIKQLVEKTAKERKRTWPWPPWAMWPGSPSSFSERAEIGHLTLCRTDVILWLLHAPS